MTELVSFLSHINPYKLAVGTFICNKGLELLFNQVIFEFFLLFFGDFYLVLWGGDYPLSRTSRASSRRLVLLNHKVGYDVLLFVWLLLRGLLFGWHI